MQSIELAGRVYPISFGFGALMEYEKETGTPATALFAQFAGNEAKLTDVATLVACGLTNASRKLNIGAVYTAQDVADLLDDTPDSMSAIMRAMEILAESFAPAEAKKKTMTATKGKVTVRTGAR